MKLPITRYGLREIALFGGAFAVVALVTAFLFPPLSIAFLLLAAAVLCFFRDPRRDAPPDPGSLVAPADGRVVDIADVTDPGMRCPCRKIAIFLSLLDVHLNRCPVDGQVSSVQYRAGRFLNALRPAASRENESNLVVLSLKDRPDLRVGVRQIAGAIARRIICEAKVGDTLCRGQTFGMIKFGSRTELLIPLATPCEILVKPGQKVKAGRSLVAKFR
ncbi:MAG: phosphatidylserine decarboxylase [Planctomycetota bacterium]